MIKVVIFSFGYKHGPPEADTVWDLRFLPNPFYVPELKEYTGLDGRVSGYVLDNMIAQDFLQLFEPLLLFHIDSHAAAGRKTLSLAVGCTGGKHRSVAMAEYLGRILKDRNMKPHIFHRDMDKE
jgi:UPF0042 nucleotide-binding protein